MKQKPEEKKEETKEKINVLAIFSYLGILVLVPLLTEKKDEFVRFHAKQGLVLLIAEIATMMVGWIPVVGWTIFTLGGIFWLVLSIFGIMNVINCKKDPIPVLGQLGERFKV